MRVYKFYKAKWGRAALENRRLKISEIDNLNDPFELLYFDVGDRPFRKKISAYKSKFANQLGVISFSVGWQHPLMWAHYAHDHRGMALEFDVDCSILRKVDYVSKRKKLPDFDALSESEIQKHMETALVKKHKMWSYENERRILPELGLCSRVDDKHFYKFGPQLVLKEVILGLEYKSTGMKFCEGGVNISTTRAMFKGYQMCNQGLKSKQKRL